MQQVVSFSCWWFFYIYTARLGNFVAVLTNQNEGISIIENLCFLPRFLKCIPVSFSFLIVKILHANDGGDIVKIIVVFELLLLKFLDITAVQKPYIIWEHTKWIACFNTGGYTADGYVVIIQCNLEVIYVPKLNICWVFILQVFLSISSVARIPESNSGGRAFHGYANAYNYYRYILYVVKNCIN